MELHVSAGTMAVIIIDLALALLIPVGAAAFFMKKTGGTLKALGVGVLTMIVFAFVAEGTINSLVGASTFGKILANNIVAYAVYGGLMAGLFEETGRFVAFKFFLKNERENDGNAFMYGVGHGGIEVILLLGTAMLNNLIYSIMINAGTSSALVASAPAEAASQLQTVFEQLANATPLLFLAAPVERISAMMFHIAASVIVWYAVKFGGKAIWLYPLAILLHLWLDASSVLVANYISNTAVVELVIFAIALFVALLAERIVSYYKKKGQITV